MRFRRHNRHPGHGRGAQQLVWDRAQGIFNVGAVGTVVGQVMFQPSAFEATSLDEQWTLRRMILASVTTVSVTNGAGNMAGRVVYGMYLDDVSAATRDPLMTNPSDNRTDWLALWCIGFHSSGGAGAVTTLDVFPGGGGYERDIRVARKVGQEEAIILTLNTVQTAGPNPAAFAISCSFSVSNLTSRTVPHR